MKGFLSQCSAAILMGVLSCGALGQSTSDTVLTGTFRETGPLGYDETVIFTCRGAPTCAGQFTSTVREENCTNFFTYTGPVTLTGVNLTQSGNMQGNISGESYSAIDRRSDGTCSPRANSRVAFTEQYTAIWNLASRTGTFTIRGVNTDGSPYSINGTFKAEIVPPPVFPMVVRSDINSVTATASADIQFRPQDVGTAGSVYVFAVAPSTIVKGGQEPGAVSIGPARSTDAKAVTQKADACVISQLNSSGQLVAVTTAQLSAYLSGTLSASGASVTILNGTPTPNVAGATFYVGYGGTSPAMLNNGVFRNAVLVPGSSVCPMLPSLTALWWNPSESGWGLNLNHQGSTVFGTLFTYDATRAPLWLVMSNGAMQSDGVTYTGDLYRTTGPAFNANPFTPIGAANVTRVGTMSMTFSDASAGTLTYTVNGVAVSKTIQRQVYGTRAANCLPTSDTRTASSNYQDLWWNPAESGWGLNVTHQDSTLFATLFTYDSTGRDMWLVMSGGTRQGDGSYLGDLYRTAGPAFNTTPFTGVTVATVGTMRLRFTDGNNGTLTYTYNGTTVTKTIQRQVFSSPVSACN